MVTQLPDGTVEFRFYRPGARHVTLAGEFNGWHKQSLPMRMGPDGWWRYQLRLAPGCYQFRYLADDEWHTDYAAFGLEHSPFGVNSVVRVDAVLQTRKTPARPPLVRFPNTLRDREMPALTEQPANEEWTVDEAEEELAVASA